MDDYELMARFYDLVNADLTEDLPFWLGLAAERGGPVLELGCGSGCVLLQLAREGLRTVGVDCSPAMLARARARLAQRADLGQRVTLIEQDVRALALGERFPLAIMPLNTFAHLLTFDDQHLALVRVAEHMAPGGWFALDVPNAAEVYGAPPGAHPDDFALHLPGRNARVARAGWIALGGALRGISTRAVRGGLAAHAGAGRAASPRLISARCLRRNRPRPRRPGR